MKKRPGMRVLVAIPTYNNRGTLKAVVRKALALRLPVLVVDDGSTDGAAATLKGLRCGLLTLTPNQGKGAALLAGAAWAEARGYSHLLTLDADGQHDPADAPALLALGEAEPWSIVVGERDFARSAAPGSSIFGRQFSNFWVWVCTGTWPGDAQCGYRLYPVAALTRLGLKARRYNMEVEVLVRGAWAGLDLLDAPISVEYSAETRKASHFRAFVDNARISWTFTKLVARNLLPWPHTVRFNLERHEARRLKLSEPRQSLVKLLKEATSPREVGLATGVGILFGALPIPGLHIWATLLAATRLQLNRLIAVNVQHLCAPPFVPVAAFEVGHWLVHGSFFWVGSWQAVWDTLAKELHLRVFEYVLGGLVLAPLLAALAGLAGWGVAWLLHRALRRKPAAQA